MNTTFPVRLLDPTAAIPVAIHVPSDAPALDLRIVDERDPGSAFRMTVRVSKVHADRDVRVLDGQVTWFAGSAREGHPFDRLVRRPKGDRAICLVYDQGLDQVSAVL